MRSRSVRASAARRSAATPQQPVDVVAGRVDEAAVQGVELAGREAHGHLDDPLRRVPGLLVRRAPHRLGHVGADQPGAHLEHGHAGAVEGARPGCR